jgi:hypothetical protein
VSEKLLWVDSPERSEEPFEFFGPRSEKVLVERSATVRVGVASEWYQSRILFFLKQE